MNKNNARVKANMRLKVLLSTSLIIFPLLLGSSTSNAGDLPNIVLIISDDHAWTDYGFMGNELVKTPTLDKLASEGVTFTHGYNTSSVCRPSLASIITGLYPHQSKIHYNHAPPGWRGFGELTNEEAYVEQRSKAHQQLKPLITIPKALRKYGYVSFQSGKFWEGHYSNGGFDEGMTVYQAVENLDYANRRVKNGDLVPQGNGDWGLLIGRKTMQPLFDFIDRHAEKPMFIYYAPFLPHLPHDAPAMYQAIYANPDTPEYVRPYYSMITWLDDTVKDLLEHLQSRSNRESLVIFLADNGWTPDPDRKMANGQYNQHKNSKRSPFDLGVRTPIIFYSPNRLEAMRLDTPVSTVDIFPTLLAFIDRHSTTHHEYALPGRDVLAENLEPLPIFGAVFPGNSSDLNSPAKNVAYTFIRDGRFKLIIPHTHQGNPPWNNYIIKPTLHDIEADPFEQLNLVEDANFSKLRYQLELKLKNWWNPTDKNN